MDSERVDRRTASLIAPVWVNPVLLASSRTNAVVCSFLMLSPMLDEHLLGKNIYTPWFAVLDLAR
jgi:hypothetical protein